MDLVEIELCVSGGVLDCGADGFRGSTFFPIAQAKAGSNDDVPRLLGELGQQPGVSLEVATTTVKEDKGG